MECPECGHKAIVAYKEEYRKQQAEPLVEVRAYVCMNLMCQETFAYRNSYMGKRERLDAEKFIRQYKARTDKSQSELFTEEEEK